MRGQFFTLTAAVLLVFVVTCAFLVASVNQNVYEAELESSEVLQWIYVNVERESRVFCERLLANATQLLYENASAWDLVWNMTRVAEREWAAAIRKTYEARAIQAFVELRVINYTVVWGTNPAISGIFARLTIVLSSGTERISVFETINITYTLSVARELFTVVAYLYRYEGDQVEGVDFANVTFNGEPGTYVGSGRYEYFPFFGRRVVCEARTRTRVVLVVNTTLPFF